jgi:hypothetical protein
MSKEITKEMLKGRVPDVILEYLPEIIDRNTVITCHSNTDFYINIDDLTFLLTPDQLHTLDCLFSCNYEDYIHLFFDLYEGKATLVDKMIQQAYK